MEKQTINILATGFMPFNNETINPSYEALKRLSQNWDPNKGKLTVIELPVSYEKAPRILIEHIQKLRPDYVICVGQAGSRQGITPEKIAVNWKEATIKDSEGYTAAGEKIRADGEDGLFTTLPIKEMVQNIKKRKIPASVSYSAGTYVCNTLMYCVLDWIRQNKEFSNIQAGFIHVPYLTEQILDKPGLPSLSLEQITQGLEATFEVLNRQ
ncbi:pyroglutamyl-peptidase I [Ileibacterium valens]|uniref:pyroglutamyl-peptidase I n=1 Tax=Ileibacterium valens TaxID=1862668 RepID=UPI00272D7D3F|nr:pyroglutamyl-peptidase I [Ileibacterium valens]